MEKFLSCDWGVSSFRLRVVETAGLKIIAEERSDEGIAKCFKLWKQCGSNEKQRLNFYFDVIREHIKILKRKAGASFDDIPLIISGMASSTIGMVHLPYKQLPFFADGSDLEIKFIKAADNFSHKTIIISGAKTNDDVMRGEETQLAGCFREGEEEQVFVFPGTHSKHIWVKEGRAIDLKTYMTGEFFQLLAKTSILCDNIEERGDLKETRNLQGFQQGVTDSTKSNLLHGSFKVRVNDLFGRLSKAENYYYLSGLVIGTEMKELARGEHAKLTLVSDDRLMPFYEAAFKLLNQKQSELKIQNADEAMVRGQLEILIRVFDKN
jgi:2-dehydro-3-deoxygalactonokinase